MPYKTEYLHKFEKMNYYFAYGLTIASEIDFPELVPITLADTPDVKVTIGRVPDNLYENTDNEPLNLYLSPTEYLLQVNGTASYYAKEGNEVIIEPYANTCEKSIRLFFLSNAMAAILYQRKQIPLHGSAIYNHDGVVLFLGDSGAGKSTTVATLETKGYRIFSDDVCVPFVKGNHIEIHAAYPMMKLWKDTFHKIDIGNYHDDARIRPDIEKYSKFFNESFSTAPRRVNKIFILEKSLSDNPLQIKTLKGIEAFKHLQNYAYRLSYIDAMDVKVAYFEMLNAILHHVPIIHISRPANQNTIHELVQLIETYMDALPVSK